MVYKYIKRPISILSMAIFADWNGPAFSQKIACYFFIVINMVNSKRFRLFVIDYIWCIQFASIASFDWYKLFEWIAFFHFMPRWRWRQNLKWSNRRQWKNQFSLSQLPTYFFIFPRLQFGFTRVKTTVVLIVQDFENKQEIFNYYSNSLINLYLLCNSWNMYGY